MSDNLVPILLITLTIVLLIILFIVMSYVLLRLRWLEGQRTGGEEPLGGTPPQGGAAPAKGGSFLDSVARPFGMPWKILANIRRSLISFAADTHSYWLATSNLSSTKGSLIASATKNRFPRVVRRLEVYEVRFSLGCHNPTFSGFIEWVFNH